MGHEDHNKNRALLALKQEMRRRAQPLLAQGDNVKLDACVWCLDGPTSLHFPDEGHLVVATKQFVYFPENGGCEMIHFSDISTLNLERKTRNTLAVVIQLKSGDRWKIECFPRKAKMIKRLVRNFG